MTATTKTADRKHHVHVVVEHRKMRNSAMLQVTDKTKRGIAASDREAASNADKPDGTTMHLGKSGTRKGHSDRVEIFTPNRPLRDVDLRKEELALVEIVNRRLRKGRKL